MASFGVNTARTKKTLLVFIKQTQEHLKMTPWKKGFSLSFLGFSVDCNNPGLDTLYDASGQRSVNIYSIVIYIYIYSTFVPSSGGTQLIFIQLVSFSWGWFRLILKKVRPKKAVQQWREAQNTKAAVTLASFIFFFILFLWYLHHRCFGR